MRAAILQLFIYQQMPRHMFADTHFSQHIIRYISVHESSQVLLTVNRHASYDQCKARDYFRAPRHPPTPRNALQYSRITPRIALQIASTPGVDLDRPHKLQFRHRGPLTRYRETHLIEGYHAEPRAGAAETRTRDEAPHAGAAAPTAGPTAPGSHATQRQPQP